MRLGAAGVLLLLGIVAGTIAAATPAWAHVTVHPSSLPAGSTDVELTFRVPNERDNANTVKLDVLFPSTLPLLTVDVLPVPGWTSAVRTTTLRKPVQTDDGEVSQVVSQVIWTAVSGGFDQGSTRTSRSLPVRSQTRRGASSSRHSRSTRPERSSGGSKCRLSASPNLRCPRPS